MRYIDEGAESNLNLAGFIETSVVLNKHDLSSLLQISVTEYAKREIENVTAQQW